MSRFLDRYNNVVLKKMVSKYGYRSVMQCPRLEKIVINIGLGDTRDNSRSIDIALGELSLISGQKAVITIAKKSISNFKLREGMPIGCMVTLRRIRMYDFFDRLVNVAMPRIRDFQGVNNNSFDKNGNYNLGIKEQYIFSEIDLDKSDKSRGMNITFVMTTSNINENREMLLEMGMPFKKKKNIYV